MKFDSKTQQFNALKNDRGVALADDNSCMGQEPSKVYGRHQDAWTEPVYCPRDQERQQVFAEVDQQGNNETHEEGFLQG